MTDKVHKIREEVARIQLYTQSEVLKQVLDYIDEVQKEPVSMWHDASEEPQGTYSVLCDGLDDTQWIINSNYIDIAYANWKDYTEYIERCIKYIKTNNFRKIYLPLFEKELKRRQQQ